MLDHFLEVVCERTKQAEAQERTEGLLEQLPADVLMEIANGEFNKQAYMDLNGGGAWLEQFKDSPLLSEAIALERESLEMQMNQQERSRAQRDMYAAEDQARDDMCVRKKMLELQLAELQSGGEAAGEVAEDAVEEAGGSPEEAELAEEEAEEEAMQAAPQAMPEEEAPEEEEMPMEAPEGEEMPAEMAEQEEPEEAPEEEEGGNPFAAAAAPAEDEEEEEEEGPPKAEAKGEDEKEEKEDKKGPPKAEAKEKDKDKGPPKAAAKDKEKEAAARFKKVASGLVRAGTSALASIPKKAPNTDARWARRAPKNKMLRGALAVGAGLTVGGGALAAAMKGKKKEAEVAERFKTAVSAKWVYDKTRKGIGKANNKRRDRFIGNVSKTIGRAAKKGYPGNTGPNLTAAGKGVTQGVKDRAKKDSLVMEYGIPTAVGGAIGGGIALKQRANKKKQEQEKKASISPEREAQIKQAFLSAIGAGLKGMGRFGMSAGKQVMNAGKAGGLQGAGQAAMKAGRLGAQKASQFTAQNPAAALTMAGGAGLGAGYMAGR